MLIEVRTKRSIIFNAMILGISKQKTYCEV
jgi:hypothetical protein